MAKPAKITLTVKPTFTATVAIPVPGEISADVVFTFKHRTRDEFKEFITSLPGSEDIDVLMDIACGWDLEEPFDRASVEKMMQIYMGAAKPIIETYISELTGARTKNS